MKTGLVSISFRNLSPDEIISLTVRAGLDSIEWGGDIHVPPGKLQTAAEVGERTRDAGLSVVCYGSYYRLTEEEPGMEHVIVRTAKALGAPLIRVWAGDLGSREAGFGARREIARRARRLAGLAADENMSVAFEFHGGTLTDTAESARELLEQIDRPNFGTLWQPPVRLSTADCVSSIWLVGEWLRNIHVFSWNGTERLPLATGAEKWRAYIDAIRQQPGEHNLMLEFVRGDNPGQLIEDAQTLKRWLKGDFES